MIRNLAAALALWAAFGAAQAQTYPAGPINLVIPLAAGDATDTAGRTVSLADFKGKHVVLEWVNPGCPYVRKHYDSGNMQELQKRYAEKGVVWYSVISSAPALIWDASWVWMCWWPARGGTRNPAGDRSSAYA